MDLTHGLAGTLLSAKEGLAQTRASQVASAGVDLGGGGGQLGRGGWFLCI